MVLRKVYMVLGKSSVLLLQSLFSSYYSLGEDPGVDS